MNTTNKNTKKNVTRKVKKSKAKVRAPKRTTKIENVGAQISDERDAYTRKLNKWAKLESGPMIRKNAKGFADLGFSTSEDRSLVMGTSTMIQPTYLEMAELGNALAVLASATYFRGTLSAAEVGTGVNYPEYTEGLAYLGNAIVSITSGGTQEVEGLPRIFDVITQLLKPKEVRIGDGLINYTPQWSAGGQFALNDSFTTSTGCLFTYKLPPGTDTVVCTPVLVPPTKEGYSVLLKVCDAESYGQQVVPLGTMGKGLLRDPSGYARTYPYFGASGTVGSLYSEAEMEVPFHFPLFSKFVPYDDTDAVVSRVFRPTSGSIVTPVGLSVTSEFKHRDLKNIIPVQYKFLDFDQLYALVCSWLVSVWDQTPESEVGNNVFSKPQQIGFTLNEFRWLLRQAVLAIFPEQCHGQFVAPVKGIPSASNSVFMPFVVDSITSPPPTFSTMILPEFIVENLCMLKSRYFPEPNARNKIHNWVPVWGVYSGDTPVSYAFTDPVTDAPVPLFKIAPDMPLCNLWDGVLTGTTNTKVCVNKFCTEYLEAWNLIVNGFAKNKSTPLSPMSADNKNKASLLMYTRILNKVGENYAQKKLFSNFENPADKFIENKPISGKSDSKKEIKKKKGEPGVTDITPATLFSLQTKAITSLHPLNAEVQGAIRYFILPSLRLNYTNGDLITMNAFQVYTGEVCQSTNIQGMSNVAEVEVYRIFANGANLSSGLFAASATNDTLTQAIKTMSDQGLGLDFLKALMGGLSSMVPVIGPILSSVIGGG